MSLIEFREHDRAQWGFGLLPVAEELCDIRLMNEASLETYFNTGEAILQSIERDGKSPDRHEQSQRFRCLHLLRDKRLALSNVEIAEHLRRTGVDIRANNVNKVLRSLSELVRRVESPGSPVRYQILTSGAAYVSYMEDWILRETQPRPA
jgi:hypothetical protein